VLVSKKKSSVVVRVPRVWRRRTGVTVAAVHDAIPRATVQTHGVQHDTCQRCAKPVITMTVERTTTITITTTTPQDDDDQDDDHDHHHGHHQDEQRDVEIVCGLVPNCTSSRHHLGGKVAVRLDVAPGVTLLSDGVPIVFR
jgi:hypothetical protein